MHGQDHPGPHRQCGIGGPGDHLFRPCPYYELGNEVLDPGFRTARQPDLRVRAARFGIGSPGIPYDRTFVALDPPGRLAGRTLVEPHPT